MVKTQEVQGWEDFRSVYFGNTNLTSILIKIAIIHTLQTIQFYKRDIELSANFAFILWCDILTIH